MFLDGERKLENPEETPDTSRSATEAVSWARAWTLFPVFYSCTLEKEA